MNSRIIITCQLSPESALINNFTPEIISKVKIITEASADILE